LSIRYLAPARLDDDLVVETRCLSVGGATVAMSQRILRSRDLLTEASVRAAFLSPAGRPARQPADWVRRYRALSDPVQTA
ncbi:MAG: hotdog domain-containing protein, partial [Sphingomonadaceae bacterium]